jgi:hypothetical protein
LKIFNYFNVLILKIIFLKIILIYFLKNNFKKDHFIFIELWFWWDMECGCGGIWRVVEVVGEASLSRRKDEM